MTYANAVLPHALFVAAERWPEEDFLDVAETLFASWTAKRRQVQFRTPGGPFRQRTPFSRTSSGRSETAIGIPTEKTSRRTINSLSRPP